MLDLNLDLSLPSVTDSLPGGDLRPFPARLNIDERVHPRRAVMRACYQMAGEADFRLAVGGLDKLEVALRPIGNRPVDELLARFRKELIDFTIRADIEDRTGELRNLIWRAAFSEAVAPPADRAP